MRAPHSMASGFSGFARTRCAHPDFRIVFPLSRLAAGAIAPILPGNTGISRDRRFPRNGTKIAFRASARDVAGGKEVLMSAWKKIRMFVSGLALAATSSFAAADFTGCWALVQGSYNGVLSISQSGTSVSGNMDWYNHADASVTGSVAPSDVVTMSFTYSSSLVGVYQGWFVDASTLNGYTWNPQLPGNQVPWSATRCP